VKRLAASVAVGGRDRGFSAKERLAAVLASMRGYRTAIASFTEMSEIEVWYSRLDVADIASRWEDNISKQERRRLEKNVDKARIKGSLRALEKLTETCDGELRIASRAPLLVPIDELAEREGQDAEKIGLLIRGLLDEYRETLDDHARVLAGRYRYVDTAHKVVGAAALFWLYSLAQRDIVEEKSEVTNS
jgi:hypothetical protein